jgi:hypothetical protein
MINFRFHVVSLIAIFLALALGVVVGAGVIDRGVVNTLNDRLDKVETKSDRIQAENDALKSAQARDAQFIEGLEPFSVPGRLTSEAVAIVAVRGVDEDRVNATVTSVQTAGGQVTGILWLEQKLALTGKDDPKTLAAAIDDPTKRGGALRASLWRKLALRLLRPVVPESGTDVLTVLQDAGFVEYDQVAGGLAIAQFPGRDALTVLVVGEQGNVPSQDVVTAAANAFTEQSLPLVVASAWAAVDKGLPRGDVFKALRASDAARTVSTVDDLDLAQGPTTITLVLADLTCVPAVVGHYGYGPDTVPIPDPANSCSGLTATTATTASGR